MTAQLSSDEIVWEQELRTVGWPVIQPADVVTNVWVSPPPRQAGKLALVWATWAVLFGAFCVAGWVLVDLTRSAVGW